MSIPKGKICKVLLQTLSYPICRADSDCPSLGGTEGLIPQTDPEERELLCPATPLEFLTARVKVFWNYGEPSAVLSACI